MINSSFSAGSAVTNLGSNFLERLGNQATSGFDKAMRSNPGGGGASESTEAPRFRSWAEGLRTVGHDRSAGLTSSAIAAAPMAASSG